MRRRQTLLVLIALLVAQFSGVAHAATTSTTPTPAPTTPMNITISPDSQELVTKPGQPVTTSFQIKNNGLQTEHIVASVKTFKANGQDGTPQLLDVSQQDDFAQWITLPKAALDIEPNVWESYSVTINPPKSAAFGYYYALDFTRAVQAKATKGNTFVTTVSGLILLDVRAPGEVRKADLVEFSTPNKMVEFLPENFTVRMHNTGNIHVAPRGNIYIYKGKKPVGMIIVNDTQGNILPNSFRKYTAQWKDGTPVYKVVNDKTKDGRFTDKTKLSWDNFKLSNLRYGKYTAELEMIYNNGQYDVPMTAKLNFWVIPWRIIAVLVVIALLILAGIWAVLIRPLRGRLKGTSRRNARFR